MPTITNEDLLKDKDIVDEINRYKWIQSEKSGHDIGFEQAAKEWVNTYSKQYLNNHPGKLVTLWFKNQPIYGILSKEIKITL